MGVPMECVYCRKDLTNEVTRLYTFNKGEGYHCYPSCGGPRLSRQNIVNTLDEMIDAYRLSQGSTVVASAMMIKLEALANRIRSSEMVGD